MLILETMSKLEKSNCPLIPTLQQLDDVKISTRKEVRMAHAQFLALCWALFLLGWTDGLTGPLLPAIQKFYDVLLFCFFFV